MSKDFESLPALVQITVNTHIAMLDAALPGRLVSYCVTGSAALGDFVAGKSDVDFIAVMDAQLKSEELERLKGIHSSLNNKRLFASLDGSYIPVEGLGEGKSAIAGCPRFNEGRYHGLKPFNMNSPDAWALKQYGICAVGNGPENLPFTVDWDLLLDGMMHNLNAYWHGWVEDCRKFWSPRALGLYFQPSITEWGVLGITRFYYTLRERDVTSKMGAGNYALETLPQDWHRIVEEALRIRRGGDALRYASVFKRRNDTLDYMDFMLRECERVYQAR